MMNLPFPLIVYVLYNKQLSFLITKIKMRNINNNIVYVDSIEYP